jgi:hypothetical protein
MSISTNSAENNTIIVNAHRKKLNRTMLNGPKKDVILTTCKVKGQSNPRLFTAETATQGIYSLGVNLLFIE